MKTMEAPDLVFQWAEKRRSLVVLAWFVALSFSLHALAFYILQVENPDAATIIPPPAQVNLLSPSTPGYRTLMRWIEAENPAAVMAPPETLPVELRQIPYKPSYLTVHATPKPAVESVEPVRFPPAMAEPDHDSSFVIRHSSFAIPPSPRVTRLRFSGDLVERAIRNRPALGIERKSPLPLQPASFLIGVTGRGEVRYIFLDHSSGDKMVDQQAEANLLRIDFVVDEREITWGIATYYLGDDAYAPENGRP